MMAKQKREYSRCKYCGIRIFEFPNVLDLEYHEYCKIADNLTPSQVQKLVLYYNDYVNYKELTDFTFGAKGKRVFKLTADKYDGHDPVFMCQLDNCNDIMHHYYGEIGSTIKHLAEEHIDFWS